MYTKVDEGICAISITLGYACMKFYINHTQAVAAYNIGALNHQPMEKDCTIPLTDIYCKYLLGNNILTHRIINAA